MFKTFIKICGITNLDDAITAINLGVDAIGFVLDETSSRYLSPTAIRSIVDQLPQIIKVGVFVNASTTLIQQTMLIAGLNWVQLHGEENSNFCQQLNYPVIKRLVPDYLLQYPELSTSFGKARILVDPGKGSGKVFDWSLFKERMQTWIIAGGLTAENIGNLVQTYQPYGVDVSSGVELVAGKKDIARLQKFVRAVRQAEK